MTDTGASDRTTGTTHLVKSEDLNHHHTLYAGRCAEWCVHAAYVTAASCFETHRPIVLMSVRRLVLRSAARLGDILTLTGQVDYVGESTLGVSIEGRRVHGKDRDEPLVTAACLFCTIDESGRATPHGLPMRAPDSAAAAASWARTVQEDAGAR